MSSPHVYDKAKYHYETIEQHGLSEEHAANHTVVFLRWLIERGKHTIRFAPEIRDITVKPKPQNNYVPSNPVEIETELK